MSRSPADRNLLFGILALQMDFIGRDALVAAMNAWVLAKHRTLGEILVDQGGLTADVVADLDSPSYFVATAAVSGCVCQNSTHRLFRFSPRGATKKL